MVPLVLLLLLFLREGSGQDDYSGMFFSRSFSTPVLLTGCSLLWILTMVWPPLPRSESHGNLLNVSNARIIMNSKQKAWLIATHWWEYATNVLNLVLITECVVSCFTVNLFICTPWGSTHSASSSVRCHTHNCLGDQWAANYFSQLPSLEIDGRTVLVAKIMNLAHFPLINHSAHYLV